jgi:hypothetical protein
MLVWYDFGDDWFFSVQLEKVEPERKIRHARTIEKHGKAPKQYSW